MKSILGRTAKCCKCYGIATHFNGWLRRGREGIIAGFCEEHKPNEEPVNIYGHHNLRGIYDKRMGESFKSVNKKSIIQRHGLNKNVIEQ